MLNAQGRNDRNAEPGALPQRPLYQDIEHAPGIGAKEMRLVQRHGKLVGLANGRFGEQGGTFRRNSRERAVAVLASRIARRKT